MNIHTITSRHNIRPQVEDERATNETETETRHDKRHEHRGRKDGEDNERSTPRDASRMGRNACGIGVRQHVVFEEVVGNVDAHEQPRVEDHGG